MPATVNGVKLEVVQKMYRPGVWVDSEGVNHHVVKVNPGGYLMCKATGDGIFKAGEMYVLTSRQVENLGMEFAFPFEDLEGPNKSQGHDHMDGSTIMAAEHIISSALSMFGGALLAYGWTHGSGALLGLAGALPFASSAWVLLRAYRNRKTR